MQSIEQRYYRETEEHNYMGCKLLVKKDDMLDSLDGKERSYDNSTNGNCLVTSGPSSRLEKKPTINS
ncbi:unnamed protein product [Pocillopora meandrina]|uniref:Uncharacterized protein n=1 Tax=Pocillopora meandrina TaxID=46732 RepID=A0AAU9Y925_9CNID|nr:unnamed protein product [Pocillopora meandrina]CAH3169975.1 unnamed protein product [Pocillopora meandrina]